MHNVESKKIKISTKYNSNNDYIHAGKRITFDRTEGGIGWSGGDKHSFLIVIGEKTINRLPTRFILAESSCSTFGQLLKNAVTLQKKLGVKRWHTKYVNGAESYVRAFNTKSFKLGDPKVGRIDEPLDANDKIHMMIEMVKDGAGASGEKTLYFFEDSSLPSELKSLPTETGKMKNVDAPAVSALGYVLRYLDEYVAPVPYVTRENSPY